MKVLKPREHAIQIKRKLVEELREYQETSNNEDAIEELADLLELIYAVLPLHGSSMEKLEKVRVEKREKRGGFEKGYFLTEVQD